MLLNHRHDKNRDNECLKIEYTDYNILLYTAKIVFSNKQNLHIFVY